MIKTISHISILILLFGSLLSTAQLAGIGKFYDHLPYNQGTVVCLAGDKVYAGVGQTLFVLDQKDNSITKLSKVNQLSDLGVTTIAYSKKHKSVIIGYLTGNIDIIVNNQVINIPDIERTSIQGFKSINDIYIDEDFAFLSTGFGIVKLDIQRQEIKETYLIGDNATNVFVNDITFYNDSIFAATQEGIYVANLNSANLSNFQNWSVLPFRLGTNFNALASNDSIIMFNASIEGNNKDTIHLYNKGVWSKLSFEGYKNADVYSIEYENEEWLLTFNDIAHCLNKNGEAKEKTFTYAGNYTGIKPKHMISDGNTGYWIADNKYGLAHRFSAWNYDVFTPSGPAYYQAFKLDFKGDALWVASGTLTAFWGNNYDKKGVYRYQNNEWDSYNRGGYDSISDISTVSINPFNTQEVYFGSWGKGLVRTENGKIKDVFQNHNSGINSLNLFRNHLVGGNTFDENGVLWVTCSGAPGAPVTNPLVAYDGKDWHEYNLENKLVNSTHAGEIFVDAEGYKWFASRDNGVFVFDDNGTLGDDNDDRVALITTGENSGNLPTKNVHCIAQDQDGKVWIGTEEGLTVLNSTFGVFDGEAKADRIIIEQDGSFQYLLETEIVKTIKVDAANRKWIGTASGGVYLISEDGQETIHHFTTENSPLISNTIFDIEIFGTTGEVFFATDKGLMSYIGDATDGDEYNGPTYAYPNPVRPDYEGLIGIKGLAENAEVKITDITGNVIYETISQGTTATWDGKSLNGKRAQTGVYIVFSVNEDGSQKEVAKILFIN